MRRLRVDSLGPYHENAADLATKLEQVIVDYLPSAQYNKRSQLCGGEGEEGNGFNMWRQLYQDNAGTSEIVEQAGIDVLREYKQCDKVANVTAHMDGWKELLDMYGSELSGCPRILR